MDKKIDVDGIIEIQNTEFMGVHAATVNPGIASDRIASRVNCSIILS